MSEPAAASVIGAIVTATAGTPALAVPVVWLSLLTVNPSVG
jgi:hypothetical protein